MLTSHQDDTSNLTLWTSIEGNIIITAACIPTLQPLMDRMHCSQIFKSSRTRSSRIPEGRGDANERIPTSNDIELVGDGRETGEWNERYVEVIYGASQARSRRESQEGILSPGSRPQTGLGD